METGERITLEVDAVRGGPRKERLTDFVMFFPRAMMRMPLSGGELRMVAALASRADPRTNMVLYSLRELGADVGMEAVGGQRVSNLIASATQKGALRKMGRSRVFVNPDLCWRGSPENRAVARYHWANPDIEFRAPWLDKERDA